MPVYNVELPKEPLPLVGARANEDANLGKEPQTLEQDEQDGMLLYVSVRQGKARQVYLYSTIQAQGNSKCLTGTHKFH